MHTRGTRTENQRSYVCPKCSSEVLSIINHPIEENIVIETASCPECNLVWKDQWILPVFQVSRR
jgi:DNA-directed RNA polymerase subunit RPC12/RpoP